MSQNVETSNKLYKKKEFGVLWRI